ncbi:MAG: Rha family transcriptional regulator [Methylococcales bacterium]
MNTETKILSPTKEELLNQNLVSIDSKHKAITTNTLKTAQYFGRNHKNILQRITTLIKNSRLTIQPSTYIDSRGKEQNYYILDRKNFSIVVLGFTGKKAEQFRVNYVEQFEAQAAELIEWRKTRQNTIEPTENANDAIF